MAKADKTVTTAKKRSAKAEPATKTPAKKATAAVKETTEKKKVKAAAEETETAKKKSAKAEKKPAKVEPVAEPVVEVKDETEGATEKKKRRGRKPKVITAEEAAAADMGLSEFQMTLDDDVEIDMRPMSDAEIDALAKQDKLSNTFGAETDEELIGNNSDTANAARTIGEIQEQRNANAKKIQELEEKINGLENFQLQE